MMRLPSFLRRLPRRIALLAAALALVLLALRVWDTQRGPPLRPWHLVVPEELRAEAIDAADWPAYLAAEEAAFATVRAEVTGALEPEDRIPANRYFAGSPLHPARFARDWNRSFVLEPAGEPQGAVVLLHGLTDTPFSLRHVGARYAERGWVAIGIRLPAHGTVPAALTDVTWEDWLAATRLAVREARRRLGPERPLHVVGFSNGGALAVKYALDAAEDPRLPRPDRLVLVSPMVGITAFARFAGLAALPALLPRFAKAAWLGILPEFIPFKYNSFPVNGARQSHRLTMALQAQLQRQAAEGRLARLPPMLTFQSVVDFTVSTRAVVAALYERLPAQGSELVLFDINRNAKLGPLLTPATEAALERLLPPAPRHWRATIVTNAGPGQDAVLERSTEGGGTEERVRPLDLAWPREIYSLSHVALPFPVTDGLYGLDPDPAEAYGVQLGALAPRGERGVLAIAPDALLRLSSNPFFPYLLARIEEAIGPAP
ncbi:alpha/beta hydrolase [Roseicella aerolata]|uniref:Alpha/beta hydrolase n=1 Tax=Roseicella aerolata TaxID=2883479 RepID=A0A9X1IIQ0_9PROT|nr:alpha/beta hydrolase [Roseicella aerolata]MCB4824789.1 alpha/beta hydrolase [Roseicella aerolata]